MPQYGLMANASYPLGTCTFQVLPAIAGEEYEIVRRRMNSALGQTGILVALLLYAWQSMCHPKYLEPGNPLP